MKRVLTSFVLLVLGSCAAFAQTGRGVISGQIRTRAGGPAAGVRVAVVEAAPGEKNQPLLFGVTQTDAEGRYRVGDLPLGRYHVIAGTLLAPTYYPGVTAPANATVVPVSAAGAVDINFPVLPRSIGLTIRGRVTRSPGAAAPTTVQLAGPENRTTPPEADGSFAFRQLLPGKYSLRVGGTGTGALSRTILLEDDSVEDLELFVHPTTAVLLKLAVQDDGPLPRFSLDLSSPQGAYSVAVNPTAEGTVPVALPAGEYHVTASGFPKEYRVDSMSYGDLNLIEKPARIDLGASSPLLLRFAGVGPNPWRRIRGRVTNTAGITSRPRGVANVQLSPAAGARGGALIPMAPVAPDGAFEFPRVLPGSYIVRVTPSPLGTVPPVVMVTERDVDDVKVVVPEQVQIRGRVTIEGGGAAPRVTFNLTPVGERVTAPRITASEGDAPPPPPPPPPTVTVNPVVSPDGSFTVSLPDGERTLTVANVPPLGDVPVAAAPYAVKSMRLGTVDLLTTPLRLAAGENRELLITLTPSVPLVTISGRVTGNNTQFRQSGKVMLDDGREARVAADGAFKFEKIPPRLYTLHASPSVAGAQQLTVSAQEGDVTGVELFVPAQVPVSGVVIVEDGAPMPRIRMEFSAHAGAIQRTLQIEANGSFMETLPEGERTLKVEVLSGTGTPAYTITSVLHGNADLLKEPMTIAGADKRQLLIIARVNEPLRTISGRVTIGNPQFRNGSVILSIAAMPDRSAPIGADGSFTFDKVLPGAYTARTSPGVFGATTAAITVKDRDVINVQLVVPALATISGRVIVEDNGPIPRVLRPTLISGSERFPSSLAVAPDGKFTASWPAGDQRVEFSPDSDYALQSARYGQADLLAGPLKINPTGAGELTITLRVTQPLFPVSGRVEGIAQLRAANPRTTYRVTLIPERSGAGLNRNPAESQIAADGTFEFPKVLPGKYTVRLNPDVTGVSQAVTVTYLPVRDITLPVPKR